MNVTLRQLRVLLAVADKGSFSAAAHAVGITQPAVSHCLRTLEDELEVRLIDRTTRMVTLTVAGRMLVEPLRRQLGNLESLLAETKQAGRQRKDAVRIACAPSMPSAWLARSLAEASRRRPDGEIAVQDMPQADALDSVRHGLSDLALIALDGTADDLTVHAMFDDPYLLVCRRDHPFARRKSLKLEQLGLEQITVLAPRTGIRPSDASSPWSAGAPPGTREAGQASAALDLVAEGLGVAIVPASSFSLPPRKSLRAVPLEDVLPRRIALATKRADPLAGAAGAVLGIFRDQASGTGGPALHLRPLTLLIPFPEGGPVDGYGRAFSHELSRALGQEIRVRNISGLGGAQGVHAVTRSPADGFTIGIAGNGATLFSPSVQKLKLFDVFEDLTFLSGLVLVPTVLVAGAHLPIRSLQELLGQARLSPGALRIGTAGTGSSRVLAELLQQATGLRFTEAPFDGLMLAARDLARGKIDLLFGEPPGIAPLLRGGAAHAILAAGRQRASCFPEVPCAAELGLPSVSTDGGYCLVAPASLPAEVHARLSTAVDSVLKSPQIARAFEDLGGLPDTRGGPRYAKFLKAERLRWRSFNAGAVR